MMSGAFVKSMAIGVADIDPPNAAGAAQINAVATIETARSAIFPSSQPSWLRM